ncbi:MAG: DUF3006 domain-containing protein [Firmicutes bacterium]|nr:DUF3006 domain-containing protein [Bacillota bacterium]
MRVIIDRFEAEYAVVELEDGSMALMATKLLPGAKEGDVVLITVDREETARRKRLIQELRKRVAQENERKT